MTGTPWLWMRHETRPTERRTPIVAADARRLVAAGIRVTVEESAHRAFPIIDYADAGCAVAPAGSWADAPADVVVVGLKELPAAPDRLIHRHVFFGHAYKGQRGAADLLRRFARGGGQLLDLEHLVDPAGRRLAAFGYWAGYAGAALAVLHLRGRLDAPLRPRSRQRLDGALRDHRGGTPARALVVGALGRCGHGARDALATAGIVATGWDIAETRRLDRAALLDHDILVNAVLTTRPVPPLLTGADLDEPGRRLRVISDVSCDVGSGCNVLPVYDSVTSWERPATRIRDGGRPVDVIAIDNLPSLLPAEASMDFSAQLLPHLMSVGSSSPVWQRCLRAYRNAAATTDAAAEPADA
ncbi:MAG: saccharopine dehydrogenase L-lysine forming [Micromonosporaceae bacterium]|nr:saccharopine dehydrogenase L-lysine forming [Micromonosporaceae bacterium]